VAKNAIVISDEVTGNAIPGERFSELARDPIRRRILRHVKARPWGGGPVHIAPWVRSPFLEIARLKNLLSTPRTRADFGTSLEPKIEQD
jgi:hypothetical protein